MGSKFDLHYAGTYFALKMGSFNVQYTLAYCKGPEPWSKGRRIACIQEMAIQLGNGQKLQVTAKDKRIVKKTKPPTLNGHEFVKERKSFDVDGQTVTAYCVGSSCQIEHPDFSVLLATPSQKAGEYTITFKKQNGEFLAAGRAGGTCGGLGRQQYHSSFGSDTWQCTKYPKGGKGSNEQKCTHGNTLQNGYEYFYNSGRGTDQSCGAQSCGVVLCHGAACAPVL